jgi:CRP/FNR family transcriptional regulator, anaerobic regulatory protein
MTCSTPLIKRATVAKLFLAEAGTHDSSRAECAAPDAAQSTLQEITELLGIPCPSQVGAELLFSRRRVKPGHTLYVAGQRFESVFVVRNGFLKTLIVDECGNEQVLCFPMKGDLLGLDGVYADRHASQVVALTECEIITIPFRNLAGMDHHSAELKYLFFRILSRELVREHAVLSLLGTLGAEARVARFLAMLSERFASLGFSPYRFNLRMTRQEIGSYLGLTLETVSRAFSALQAEDLIRVDQKSIEIKSLEALKTIERVPARAGAKSPSRKGPTSRAEPNPLRGANKLLVPNRV